MQMSVRRKVLARVDQSAFKFGNSERLVSCCCTHLTTSPFDQAHIGRVVKPVVFLDSGFRRAEQTIPGTSSTRARKPGRRLETFWQRTLPQHHLAMMKGYGRSGSSLSFCMTRLESETADPRQNSRQGSPYMSSLPRWPRWPQSRSLGPNHYSSRLKLITTSQLSRCAFSAIGRRPVKRPPEFSHTFLSTDLRPIAARHSWF